MAERWRIALWVGAAALLVMLGTASSLVSWAWRVLHEPYQGYDKGEVVVEVPKGSDAVTILESLEDAGILRNADLARLYLVYRMQGPFLQAGEYRFNKPLSTPEVLAKLVRGEIVTYPVTIIEGLTLTETAATLAAAGFGSQETFLETMRDPRPIADLDPTARDLEGYLFPDTYRFARGTTEAQIVDAMVTTFRRLYEESVTPLLTDDDERTLRQIVTLASIVEREAQLDEERPVIAGVYAHRLRRRMPLQADPTVIYALSLAGEYDGNLRRDDLKFDSPYNTYVYSGLPPGPIASPGLASLQAAAAPADVPYLYFVSRNDGSHVFAETLREHNRNVHEWQKVYWRKKWAEERRQKETEQGPTD
jgi:UPF0755 protein